MISELPNYLEKVNTLSNYLMELAQNVDSLKGKGSSSKGANAQEVQTIIARSMEGYNDQIERLKYQIAEHTDENIKKAIMAETKTTFTPMIKAELKSITTELNKKNQELQEKYERLNQAFSMIEGQQKQLATLKKNQENIIEQAGEKAYQKMQATFFPKIEDFMTSNEKLKQDFSKNNTENKALSAEMRIIRDNFKKEKDALNQWQEQAKKDLGAQKSDPKIAQDIAILKNSLGAQTKNAMDFRNELNDVISTLKELARSKVEESAPAQPLNNEPPKSGLRSFLGL